MERGAQAVLFAHVFEGTARSELGQSCGAQGNAKRHSFWLELGVDGFRADAVRWMSKDPGLRDDPVSPFFHGEKPVEFDDLQHRYSRFGRNYLTICAS